MRAPSRSFFRRMKTDIGLVIEGQMLDVKDNSTIRDFVLPRRQLLVSVHSAARPGIVVQSLLRSYLLIDRAEKARDMTRVFNLAEITDRVNWSRQVTHKDRVTGLDRGAETTSLGMIEVAKELMKNERDGEDQTADRYRVLCGAELHVGDMVDGKPVRFVQKVQGITYGEIG